MLPRPLITQYWKEVAQILGQQYGFTTTESQAGIDDLRMLLDRHKVGDVIYNRNASDVAESIARLVRQGFLDNPEMLEPVTVESSSDEKPRIAEPRRKKKA